MVYIKDNEYAYELYKFIQNNKFVECFLSEKLIDEMYIDKFKLNFVKMINVDVLKKESINKILASSVLSTVEFNNNYNDIISLIREIKFNSVNSYLFYRVFRLLLINSRIDVRLVARVACRFNGDKLITGFLINDLINNSLELFLNPQKSQKSIQFQNAFVMMLVHNRNSPVFLRNMNEQNIYNFINSTLEILK